jgi:hypothetical protein
VPHPSFFEGWDLSVAGWPQAFDLTGINNTGGAPSFAREAWVWSSPHNRPSRLFFHHIFLVPPSQTPSRNPARILPECSIDKCARLPGDAQRLVVPLAGCSLIMIMIMIIALEARQRPVKTRQNFPFWESLSGESPNSLFRNTLI